MKIGYISSYDATDLRHWSGSGYNIWKSLERQGHEIIHFQPSGLPNVGRAIVEMASKLVVQTSGRRYLRNHSVLLSWHQSKQVNDWVERHPEIEAIVSPGTIPVAFVASHKPLITWADATHRVLFNTYPEFKDISKLSHYEGSRIEHGSLARASAAIFSSEWAARSAVDDYGAPAERVHVVPFGANLEIVPSAETVSALINAKTTAAPQILFIGVDWERKGGNTALQAVRYLRQHGMEASLRIVGCEAPDEVKALPWVLSKGFFDKRTTEGRDRIDVAFRAATLLMVPSLAECYGLVYCEANAYGIPAIGSDVGGVSTIIRDGENGYLLNGSTFTSKVGDRILALLNSAADYQAMSRNARLAYDERLNWDVAGCRAAQIISSCVKNPRSN